MSRETTLVKNTFILSIGTVLPKLAAFVTLPVLTACLSKKQYGAYDLVTTLVMLVMPVLTLQIHTAAFRFLIEHHNDRDLAKLYLSNIMAFVLPIGVLAVIVIFCFLPVQDTVLRLCICTYLFADIVVSEIRQVTRGMARNLDYSISSIVSAMVRMVFIVLLVKALHYELTGAIVALAISPVLSLAYLFVRVRMYELIDFSLFDPQVLKEMLAYSWPMVPNNMSMWVMRVSDRFVVTLFMGVAANAVYAVANKIPSLLSLAQSTFTLAWQENASIVSKDKDAAEYYSKMFSVMLNLYAGFLGLLIACTPILFALLIRGSYEEAYQQMPVLFLGMFFSCMSTFLGGIYIAFKATKSVGVSTMLAALCNFVVDLALIRYIGLYAASGSTLISYAFLFAYRMADVRKLVAIRYNVWQMIFTMSFLIVESALCYINSFYTNCVNVILGTIIFLVLNKDLVKGFFVKGTAFTRKMYNRFIRRK